MLFIPFESQKCTQSLEELVRTKKNKSKEWGRVVGRAAAHRHWKVRFLGMKQKIKMEIKKKKNEILIDRMEQDGNLILRTVQLGSVMYLI